MSLPQQAEQGSRLSYSSFTLDQLRRLFGIEIALHPFLDAVHPIPPTDLLKAYLQRSSSVTLLSEKARSEFIVAPTLLEVKEHLQNKISIYSGVRFDVAPDEGLQGVCDFIISKTPPLPTMQAPLIVMVEAKKNDIEEGLGQCAAEMIAAQRFNQIESQAKQTVYGCVTTGELWQFLQLVERRLTVDPNKLYIEHIDKIIGVFVAMATNEGSEA